MLGTLRQAWSSSRVPNACIAIWRHATYWWISRWPASLTLGWQDTWTRSISTLCRRGSENCPPSGLPLSAFCTAFVCPRPLPSLLSLCLPEAPMAKPPPAHLTPVEDQYHHRYHHRPPPPPSTTIHHPLTTSTSTSTTFHCNRNHHHQPPPTQN